jgi:hypothetical protein
MICEWRNSLVPIKSIPPDVLFLIPAYLSSRYGIVSLGSLILKGRVVRCPLQDDIQSSLPPSVFLPASQSLSILLSFLFPCTHLFLSVPVNSSARVWPLLSKRERGRLSLPPPPPPPPPPLLPTSVSPSPRTSRKASSVVSEGLISGF